MADEFETHYLVYGLDVGWWISPESFLLVSWIQDVLLDETVSVLDEFTFGFCWIGSENVNLPKSIDIILPWTPSTDALSKPMFMDWFKALITFPYLIMFHLRSFYIRLGLIPPSSFLFFDFWWHQCGIVIIHRSPFPLLLSLLALHRWKVCALCWCSLDKNG